jgi:hypothetical protein
MIPSIVLSAFGFFLLWKGYTTSIQRDKRFRKGSKFVFKSKTLIFWGGAIFIFSLAAFFINHA